MFHHLTFDLLAAASAAAVTALLFRGRWSEVARGVERGGTGYALALLLGAGVGGFGLGTLNLWWGGVSQVGRSSLGALAGAVLAVECFKARRGMRGSTGFLFVPGLTVSLVVGRLGCFFAGIEDQTHGTPTTLPWGHDFGDGVLRHPVPLYESGAMALFLVVLVWAARRHWEGCLRRGFHALVLWYALQRFAWEWWKPYRPVLGPLNLFHLVALALAVYAALMLWRSREEVHDAHRRALPVPGPDHRPV